MNDIEILKTVAAALQKAGERLVDKDNAILKSLTFGEIVVAGQTGMALAEAAVICRNAAKEIDDAKTADAEERLRAMGIEPLPADQRKLTHLIARRDDAEVTDDGIFSLCCGYNYRVLIDGGDFVTSNRELASCTGRDHANLVAAARETQAERDRTEAKIAPEAGLKGLTRIKHHHEPVSARHGTFQGHTILGGHISSHRHAGSEVEWADGTRMPTQPGDMVISEIEPDDEHTVEGQIRRVLAAADAGSITQATALGHIARITDYTWTAEPAEPAEPSEPARKFFEVHPHSTYLAGVPTEIRPPANAEASSKFWQTVVMAIVRQGGGGIEVNEHFIVDADRFVINWRREGVSDTLRFWLTTVPGIERETT